MKKTILIAVACFVIGFAAAMAVAPSLQTKPAAPAAPVANAPVVEKPAISYLNASADQIEVTAPEPGAVITSPLTFRGRAVGNWFFEASAPAQITDKDGRVLAEHFFLAQGDWMTTEKVPFEGTLAFEKPSGVTDGFLIIRNDNPSGLPEHEKSVRIPVRFE